MGNAAVAEKLPGADELDELYRLDASETDPEAEPEGDEESAEESGAETGGMPHPVQPEGMPHP
jgi:hypothetical protein